MEKPRVHDPCFSLLKNDPGGLEKFRGHIEEEGTPNTFLFFFYLVGNCDSSEKIDQNSTQFDTI